VDGFRDQLVADVAIEIQVAQADAAGGKELDNLLRSLGGISSPSMTHVWQASASTSYKRLKLGLRALTATM